MTDTVRARRLGVFLVAAALTGFAAPACLPKSEGAVSLKIRHPPKTPRDASVIIDEEYIGPLGYVARHGVRLPVGEHRITVEKEGYFPHDELVNADRTDIVVDVELEPIPD